MALQDFPFSVRLAADAPTSIVPTGDGVFVMEALIYSPRPQAGEGRKTEALIFFIGQPEPARLQAYLENAS